MKKLLLALTVLAGSAMFMTAAPKYQWHRLVDSQYGTDSPGATIVTTDGKLVTINHLASASNTEKLTFGGEEIGVGTTTNQSSQNKNLVIIKQNIDGSRAWSIYSAGGDIDCGGTMTTAEATDDGGIVVALRPRTSNVNPDYYTPVFVNADGSEYKVEDWNTSGWIYNALIVKISKDGEVEWTRTIRQSQAPLQGGSKDITDGVDVNALATDSDGNLYLAGRLKSAMVLSGKNNSCYVINPRNVTVTNGVASTKGGIYLVKLDKEGNYLANLSLDGNMSEDNISALAFADGKLYFAGNVQGTKDAVFTIGDKSLTLATDYNNLLVGCCDADLKMDYAALYPTTSFDDKKAPNLQVKNIAIIDGALYAMGAVNGGIAAPGESEPKLKSVRAALDGYAVKMNAADGAYIASKTYGNTISSCYDVFKANGKVWIYSYLMNAAEGATLIAWDETAEAPERYHLITNGGSPVAYGAAYNPADDMLYLSTRGNQPFAFYGETEKSEAPQGFGGVIAAFKLNDSSTAAELTVAASMSYAAEQGAVVVNSADGGHVEIVDAAGLVVYSGEVAPGRVEIALNAGLYIVNNTKLLVK